MFVMETENKLKILIVDNHAELVKQIKARLSMEEDFEVCRVAPLDSLTEAILECQPDLLLIDPYFEQSYKYDRIQMAKELDPQLMIVVLTAVVDTASSVRFKKEGVHCVLEKGVNSIDLVESLRKVIQEACSAQTASQK
jgi:DNA-binding NarL/FixJ family response regulator